MSAAYPPIRRICRGKASALENLRTPGIITGGCFALAQPRNICGGIGQSIRLEGMVLRQDCVWRMLCPYTNHSAGILSGVRHRFLRRSAIPSTGILSGVEQHDLRCATQSKEAVACRSISHPKEVRP